MFETYLSRLGLTDVQIEAVMDIHRSIFEQVTNDVNTKAVDSYHGSGSLNRRPSLMGARTVGVDNDEWFPRKTVSKKVAERAKAAQMGCRIGVWPGAGRTVLGKSNALSTENVCADTSGPQQ